MTAPLPLGPAAAAHYEAVRPVGPGITAPPSLGVNLLQRCGLAIWAHTCCGSAAAPQAGGAPVPGRLLGAVGRSLPLPETVRHQMVAVLASMVLHQRNGGSHDLAGSGNAPAVDTTLPA